MAINCSQQVYAHTYDTFARPVTFMPAVGPSFEGRGIWTTQKFDIETETAAIIPEPPGFTPAEPAHNRNLYPYFNN